MKRVLIANRAEIAIRIARAIRDLGMTSIALYSEDDATSLHRSCADHAVALKGTSAKAYLDLSQIIAIAKHEQCDGLHPGIGFLSEDPQLAQRCVDAGIQFIGPDASSLQRFGNKREAKTLAQECQIPTLPTYAWNEYTEASLKAYIQSLTTSQLMVKASSGGGGRGLRTCEANEQAIKAAVNACQQEAQLAFDNGDVYLEPYIAKARHVEVQLIGDGKDVVHLGTRDCTLQRRHQKLMELAPAAWLSPAQSQQILDAACTIGQAHPFKGAITVEFLVPLEASSPPLYFMEINPRLQVEHTVTEAITSLDIVQLQLRIASGASLGDLSLSQPPPMQGYALQARLNAETYQPHGQLQPTTGRCEVFRMPGGPGIRVDTMAYQGYELSPHYDSLIAKLIARADTPEQLQRRAYAALCEAHVTDEKGQEVTNLPLLRTLVQSIEPLFSAALPQEPYICTTYVEEELERLLEQSTTHTLHHLSTVTSEAPKTLQIRQAPDIISAHMSGTIVQLPEPGETIAKGQPLVVLAAMKMEHVLSAPHHGTVKELFVEAGQTVQRNQAIVQFAQIRGDHLEEVVSQEHDLDAIRPDLAEVQKRHDVLTDDARPKAVEKRHSRGFRTARENIGDLCDAGSFIEYGPLALAAQRGTHDTETLVKRTPADGIITGLGDVNGDSFGHASRCAILSYDYTVLAGTQGYQGHRKTDRLLHVAKEAGYPVLFFTEGGGGRPSDTDLINIMVSGLECASFRELASLQGEVPLIGINNGRCFAGNAALLGCCDVIIATKSSNIGMGGPAMIEGGGLGQYKPEEIGPIDAQVANGVVDIKVESEAEAVAVAKKYLGYFQGTTTDWRAPDARKLRHVIPENRLRMYQIHDVLDALVDEDSLLELRPHFAKGMLTAFARIEGVPLGIIANNPAILAGAIDTPGASKAARFMQLCEQFDIPLLLLCDTPGIMVGPEAEQSGTVRAAASMFIAAARLKIPFGTIVLRKSYGLGAQAMAGGHFKAPRFIVSWPTGEFGPMGLEGAVRLGFRKQLAAIEDPKDRAEMFDQMVAMLYERGKALNIASLFEIDDVIDPIQSRAWIKTLL